MRADCFEKGGSARVDAIGTLALDARFAAKATNTSHFSSSHSVVFILFITTTTTTTTTTTILDNYRPRPRLRLRPRVAPPPLLSAVQRDSEHTSTVDALIAQFIRIRFTEYLRGCDATPTYEYFPNSDRNERNFRRSCCAAARPSSSDERLRPTRRFEITFVAPSFLYIFIRVYTDLRPNGISFEKIKIFFTSASHFLSIIAQGVPARYPTAYTATQLYRSTRYKLYSCRYTYT